jgi:O-antigen/teichoic acid export membrane protein
MASNNSTLILKNSFLFTVAPLLPKVINVFLMPIMTRYLTDVDFGIAGTISAYTQAIGAFSVLGLGVVLLNSFYKTPLVYRSLWRRIYGFLNIWMIIYAVAQAVLLYFIIPEEALDNRWWIIILTNFSTVFFGPTATIGQSYYQYNKQAFPVVWRSLFASAITIIVDFVLIVYLRWGYMGWYVGTFAGTFFSNASYWYVVNYKLELRPNYRFKWKEIKHALTVSVPTIPHYYTSYLLDGSGRMVLDQYNVPQGEIGRVSMTQQIGGLFSMVMTGMNQAISPFFMQYIKEDKEETARKLSLVYVAICFAAAFFVSMWSKELFDILISNESLKTAYPFCIAYVMALCYRPMYVIAVRYNFYYEKTKQLLLISFLSGIIAVLLYIALTPFIGVWGFLVGHYVASLYYGYSGYFFSCYRQNSKMRFPYLLILFIQFVLTGLAFLLVDLLLIKIIVTLILGMFVSVVIYKNKKILVKEDVGN